MFWEWISSNGHFAVAFKASKLCKRSALFGGMILVLAVFISTFWLFLCFSRNRLWGGHTAHATLVIGEFKARLSFELVLIVSRLVVARHKCVCVCSFFFFFLSFFSSCRLLHNLLLFYNISNTYRSYLFWWVGFQRTFIDFFLLRYMSCQFYKPTFQNVVIIIQLEGVGFLNQGFVYYCLTWKLRMYFNGEFQWSMLNVFLYFFFLPVSKK